MSLNVDGIGMTLIVKKVRRKLYVYEQYRIGNRVVTKYIGPLEEIVRVFQLYRLSNGQVNYKISKRDLKWMSRRIAMDVVSLLGCDRCGGWDLNPRRPTPSGPEPESKLNNPATLQRGVNYNNTGPIQDNTMIKGFLDWCIEKGTSRETCEQYARYLQKPFDPNNKWSRLAWKLYYKFIGREDLWKEIKVKRSGVDLYIPSDEDVLQALSKACESSQELCIVYKLLIYSGLRLEEVVKVISEQEEDKWIKTGGFWKYPLAWKRGSKQAFYMYTLEKPVKMRVSSKWISNWAAKNDVLSPKYLRKWVATKMLSLGIPEEVVNFIQGRVPQDVLSKHYLKLSTLADQYYKKYAEWIKKQFGFST